MRIEIPDGFDIGPLLRAIAHEVHAQQYRVIGEVRAGEYTLIVKPHQQIDAAALSEGRAIWQQTRPGLVLLGQDEHPKVIPINHRRATRGGSTPPRVA